MVVPTKIRSSYKHPADFGDLLGGIVAAKRPLRRIAEYGILDGFSLDIFAKLSPNDCLIEARDIFEHFEGNRAQRPLLEARFGNCSKVRILDGDFHEAEKDLEAGVYDLIHIDIANDGAVYEEAVHVLISKLAPGGLLLLEGGTFERDSVPWMLKLGKPPIAPEVERLKSLGKYDVTVLGVFPGLTVIRPK